MIKKVTQTHLGPIFGFVSFRTFRGPLFHKRVSGQLLFCNRSILIAKSYVYVQIYNEHNCLQPICLGISRARYLEANQVSFFIC